MLCSLRYVHYFPKSNSSYYPYLFVLQDLYCVRSDLGNLLKAMNRLDEAKVRHPFPPDRTSINRQTLLSESFGMGIIFGQSFDFKKI